MGRTLRIYKEFLRTSLSRDLEFRANFMMNVARNIVWVAFSYVVIFVIFSQTKTVAGWNQALTLSLASVSVLVHAIFQSFCSALMEIPQQVRLGTLDFVVTRPIDSQFWVTTRRFGFDRMGNLLVGLAGSIYFAIQGAPHASAFDWVAFAVLIPCSVLLYYCFCMNLMTLAIFWVKVDNLWVLAEMSMDAARYPLDVYPSKLKSFFLFVLPIGLLAYLPVNTLRVGADPLMLGIGVLWTVTLLILTRLFWTYAMRSYSSASS